ncbi:MAG: plastocyanin/azurin family copper-binding protein [Gemmatimonadota bacterium]|nr:plastocyanin/azurin family copper-binding protein [Gemmatimonadota bacterium]
MQFKGLALVAGALVLGTYGLVGATPAAARATVAAQAAKLAPITGKTWEVKMVGDAKGYRFEPANLTIKAGDGIKFVMVGSQGPHNVAFDGAKLAAPVKAQLTANLGTQKLADLMSAMTLKEGDAITISFAKIPAGTYTYNCTPHLAMGMKGVITVQ